MIMFFTWKFSFDAGDNPSYCLLIECIIPGCPGGGHHWTGLQVSSELDRLYLVICVGDLNSEHHPHDEGHGGDQEYGQEHFVKHLFSLINFLIGSHYYKKCNTFFFTGTDVL